jgi:hypothetical protein
MREGLLTLLGNIDKYLINIFNFSALTKLKKMRERMRTLRGNSLSILAPLGMKPD